MESRHGIIHHKRSRTTNQHLHIITLGVRDFEKSKKFYTEILGWQPSSAGQGEIAFFQAGDIVFSIYSREKLAEDALIDPEGHGFAGITLGYNTRSESEVDKIISNLKMIIAGKWLTILSSLSMKMEI